VNAAVTGGFTLLWAAGAAILVRPIFEWSSLPSGGRLEAYGPMQNGDIVLAVAAFLLAGAVALTRRAGALNVGTAAEEPTGAPPKAAAAPMAIAKRAIGAALLTVGLGGMITAPLDAVVLFATLAGAAPIAQRIGARLPLGGLLRRVPSIARLALSIPLVYLVSYLLIDAELLKGISEFFPVIVVFAIGLFVVELITAERAGRVALRPTSARAATAAVQ
jgi:hypothetical protein